MVTAVAERAHSPLRSICPTCSMSFVPDVRATLSAAPSSNPKGSGTLRIVRKVTARGYPKQSPVSNGLLVCFAWILLLANVDISIKTVCHLSSTEDRRWTSCLPAPQHSSLTIKPDSFNTAEDELKCWVLILQRYLKNARQTAVSYATVIGDQLDHVLAMFCHNLVQALC